jgi:hypothetical protein
MREKRNRATKSKYWRNNLVELGSSLSVFLDILASFPRLVCQTNVLNPLLRRGKIPSIRESKPAPLGLQSAMIIIASFRPAPLNIIH